MRKRDIKRALEADLARAEAVQEEPKRKRRKTHGPTQDYFRGEENALRKALHMLGDDAENEEEGDVDIAFTFDLETIAALAERDEPLRIMFE